MRFLDLHLKAFGPFTDRRLDLSGGGEGLHLVFGPNEAGKSSALRALKVLLYGFPPRSGDDFLHPYEQLRVGARLRLADGAEREVLRRKGRKGTLLAGDDQTLIDESLLARCLQGVDEALFSSLFGLDHDALVQGGEELLAQQGDVGQALFAAGLGTRNLRQVLQDLDGEAEALFLPKGSKPRINLGVAEHREAKRELAALSLAGREWDAKRKQLDEMREESARLQGALAERKGIRQRMQRIRRVQPRLAERRDLLVRSDELGEVVLLPADFAARRRAAGDAIRAAVVDAARAGTELAELRQQAASLVVARPLLDQAETLERLHQGVQLYVKGVADRSRLLGEQGEQRAMADRLLEELRPGLTVEEAATLRPSLGRWVRIQELGSQRQAAWKEAAQARDEAAEAETALAATRQALAALAAPRDPALLRRFLEAARKVGDLDLTLAEAAPALGRDEAQLRRDLDRLGLWRGSPAALEALPVPGEETLRRFQDDFADLAGRRRTLAEQTRACGDGLAETGRRLDEIRRAGAVPSEEEMAAARASRDRGWERVRRAWLGREKIKVDPAAFERSVQKADETTAFKRSVKKAEEITAFERSVKKADQVGAFERSVKKADEIADRLRREVGRVQEQATLLARQQHLRRTAEDLAAASQAAAVEQDRLTAEWQALWRPCGIDPLPPREMHPAWTGRYEKLRSRTEALREQRRRIETLRAARAEHRGLVCRQLAALGEAVAAADDGEGLELILARGEEVVRRLDGEAAERTRLAAALDAGEQRLARAQAVEAAAGAALVLWQAAWGEAIEGLGLDRAALPSEAVQTVETLRQAFAKLGEADKLERRLAGIERDLVTFRAAVRALAGEMAPDLARQPAEQAAVALQARLSAARRAADRGEDLDRRSRKLEEQVRAAEVTRQAMEDSLARLVAEAGAADASGLEAAEQRSAWFHDLRRELERTERLLLEEGAGLTLDALEREAQEVTADELAGRIDQLDREIGELEARSLELREELGKAQQALQQMAGGDAAARQAERSQEILAGLRADVERYVRVRLAASVLRREIERYRSENQDPLLRRAAEQFAILTLGRYSGLRSDFDDGDQPVLAALRRDGRSVRVEQMSDGTRDQLYLALRLATLERYLAHAEPLPFVVDDILVNFDDERSAATLKVLAELGAKTQVILFTHHARLRDLAAALPAAAGVFVQELEAS